MPTLSRPVAHWLRQVTRFGITRFQILLRRNLSLEQAADYLGVTSRTLSNFIAEGRIHPSQEGSETIIPLKELQRFVTSGSSSRDKFH